MRFIKKTQSSRNQYDRTASTANAFDGKLREISTLGLLVHRAKKMGGEIRLAGVSQDVMDTLSNCGLDCEIGVENIFMATEIPYKATRRAIE